MNSLTEQYAWSVLEHSECNTAKKNFDGIRNIKRQSVARGVESFQMRLNEKGKKEIPGLVLSYWRDLDRAFNSAYQDVMQRFVGRAMANRAMMSARVQQVADTRSKYDESWCYEWEDCHTRAFLLFLGDIPSKGMIRPLNQRRAVLSGAAKAQRKANFDAKIGDKRKSKALKKPAGSDDPEPLIL